MMPVARLLKRVFKLASDKLMKFVSSWSIVVLDDSDPAKSMKQAKPLRMPYFYPSFSMISPFLAEIWMLQRRWDLDDLVLPLVAQVFLRSAILSRKSIAFSVELIVTKDFVPSLLRSLLLTISLRPSLVSSSAVILTT